MAVEHLLDMGLDVDRVMAAAGFLEAYAETCLLEMEQEEPTSVTAAVPPSQPDQDPEDTRWVPQIEAATALRDAGQWMLFPDPSRARDLLERSGRLYTSLGYGYGTFLLTATGWTPSPPAYEPFDSWIPAIPAVLSGYQAALPPPLQHPQQQAYAILAIAGQEQIHLQYREDLAAIISMSRNGVVPVGALGTPVMRLWEIADSLVVSSYYRLEGIRTIARHLEAMALRYRESMELAQVNQHLWRNAAAPVDVGDLDMAGITAIATRRFGRPAIESELFPPGSPLDPIARAPIEAGLDLAALSGPRFP
jgi:hypothetical protein